MAESIGAAALTMGKTVMKQGEQIIPRWCILKTGAGPLRPMLFGQVKFAQIVRASHHEGFRSHLRVGTLATSEQSEKQKAGGNIRKAFGTQISELQGNRDREPARSETTCALVSNSNLLNQPRYRHWAGLFSHS